MIDAYIDESGIHDGAKVCVIAGYWGGRGQWRKFEKDWRSLLRTFGVPLEKFHATELLPKRGFFFDWDRATHGSFLDGVVATITRYKIYPVNFGIIVDDFNSFTEIQRRFLTGATLQAGNLVTSGNPKKPYFLPFQHCMKTVASYAPVGGKAHFFFGVDRQIAKYATSLYTMIKTTGPHHEYNDRLGDVSYPLASQTPPLQAADFLALMTYQYMLEKYRKQDWEMMPPPKLVACVSKTRMAGDHFLHNRDTLQASLTESYVRHGHWDEAVPEDPC